MKRDVDVLRREEQSLGSELKWFMDLFRLVDSPRVSQVVDASAFRRGLADIIVRLSVHLEDLDKEIISYDQA